MTQVHSLWTRALLSTPTAVLAIGFFAMAAKVQTMPVKPPEDALWLRLFALGIFGGVGIGLLAVSVLMWPRRRPAELVGRCMICGETGCEHPSLGQEQWMFGVSPQLMRAAVFCIGVGISALGWGMLGHTSWLAAVPLNIMGDVMVFGTVWSALPSQDIEMMGAFSNDGAIRGTGLVQSGSC